jgi:hypothetical protein
LAHLASDLAAFVANAASTAMVVVTFGEDRACLARRLRLHWSVTDL